MYVANIRNVWYMKQPYSEDLGLILESAKIYFKDPSNRVDFKAVAYSELLDRILRLQRDYPRSPNLGALRKEYEELEVSPADFMVIAIEKVLEYIRGAAVRRDFVVYHGMIYYYDGKLWGPISQRDSAHSDLREFLTKVVQMFGVRKVRSSYYKFRFELYRQFVDMISDYDRARLGYDVIYFRNKVLQLNRGDHVVREPLKADFQLHDVAYDYDAGAVCPLWDKFLDQMLPEKDAQQQLHEFMYYCFIVNQARFLKLEKVLFLLGGGSNGKSVVMDVLVALLGQDNVCSYSLPYLTSPLSDGLYARASFSDKLLNYSSEAGVTGRIDYDMFKQLVSQEGFAARHPYGRPFTASRCGKMIFNANRKPASEPTAGYFRRLLLLDFDKKVPDGKEDISLAQKIIKSDLSGVMNKVLLAGVQLWQNKRFTESAGHKKLLVEWKVEKDNVSAFLEDRQYSRSTASMMVASKVFEEYKEWASEHGYPDRFIIKTNVSFYARLRGLGFKFHKNKVKGVSMVYMESPLSVVASSQRDMFDSGGDGEVDEAVPF